MYKDFAYIYDKLSFDLEYEKYSQNIKRLCDEYKIKKVKMLELACGTGMLTQYFFDDFDHIDALDLSQSMLEVFSKKHQEDNVSLYNYNMVDFLNENSYDLIVILLDSINYVTDEDELRKLFKNSYKNLKEGGLLVFDINSAYKMDQVFGSNSFVYEYEDIFYTRDNIKEGDIIDMELNFFIKNNDGSYKRIVENQIERYYSIDFMKALLKNNNFTDIKILDEDTFAQVKDYSLRILFSARKDKNERR
ncbi:class I SAM-dependent methyltransferase [Anaerococcus sp. AGMB00486]|uniref:Class I SAM-dependent methyltransferase n=2 Tax=Anaerococcus TaxID=165779 RepID=A0ABX2NBF9_9FIRM|nr:MULTISPECIES: class I SAM-dependent methyltransferase [Anaerococcus]MDY3006436.1 class I SAM-dependent methyltransferase [Anaerococcus porci]MSS78251.1 class I SAM-dependent methyltransferase [Anaerococcus porci]NVF12009.1 class I SAM-dependent methyltransferase [Anaerococcus faecalis]